MVIKKVILQVTDVKIDTNVQFGSTEETPFATNANKGEVFIEDASGVKYKKNDGTFAKDEWIDISDDLYRFDKGGLGYSGSISENGQIFTFEKGKLISVKFDNDYKDKEDAAYFSAVSSQEYIVFLAKDEEVGGYYPIKYKHLETEKAQNDIDTVYYLGTETKKQYSSPYKLQIDSNYIYYMCVGRDTDFCGKVNRMRMNATLKETFGKNVEGYIAVCNAIWYYEGGKLIKATKGDKEGVAVNKKIEELIKPIDETTAIYVPGVDTKEEFNIIEGPPIAKKDNNILEKDIP